MSELPKRRILVVDDEPAVRLVLSYSLEQMGFSVEVASNGFDALKALELHTFDAVVMDINMPRMSGIETCARIVNRKTAAGHPPIWLMTGMFSDEIKQRGIAVGARAVLAKPFNCQQLVKQMEADGLRGP